MKDFTTHFITTEELPLVIEPKNPKIQLEDFLNLLQEHNVELKQKLLKHGGLLFRNFPIQQVKDFVTVIKQLGTGKFIDYIGGDSPRIKVTEGVYTSTEAPPSIKIPLHNELSFVKHYPSHIYFYCDTPPIEKGETILADARKIYQTIDKDVRKRFTERQLKYVSCYHYKSKTMNFINRFHKSWIDVFETHNKNEVEEKCQANEFAFKWHSQDWIQISQIRPAVIPHPKTQEMIWFNQAHLFDFNPKLLGWGKYLGTKLLYAQKHKRLHEVFFADHTRIPRQDLYHILDKLDEHTLYFPWQKGDILVLDNVLAMHGRATFKGKRRILTAMTGS